jgi:hypothetical protein
VKITPALPSPYQPTVPQDRSAVSAVCVSKSVRDSTERPGRGQLPTQPVGRTRYSAHNEPAASRLPAPSLQATQALASYARVAEYGERSSLRDLLGFDAYA